jgi:hypothetical protein
MAQRLFRLQWSAVHDLVEGLAAATRGSSGLCSSPTVYRIARIAKFNGGGSVSQRAAAFQPTGSTRDALFRL